MKSSLLAIGLTATLSIAAGVAIAGLPSDQPGALVIGDGSSAAPSSSIEPSDVTDASPGTTATAATAEESVSTVPVSTDPADTVPLVSVTDSLDDGANASSDDTDASNDSGDSDDSDDSDDEAAPDPLDDVADRALLQVGSANAGARSGVATEQAQRLIALGYSAVQPFDAINPSAVSRVYYVGGFDLAAARLAEDLGWDPTDIAPISEMPPVDTGLLFELVAMIGLDLAPPR